LNDSTYEVKSTISRYGATVTINSQYQLQATGKKLSLVFCGFEKPLVGTSISDIMKDKSF